MSNKNLYEQTYLQLIETNNPVAASGWGGRSELELFFLSYNIISKLNLNSDDSLLEIGCGSGLISIPILGICRNVVLTDFLEEMVDLAKKNTNSIFNSRFARLNILDAKDFDKVDIKFNKILCNSVLQALGSNELIELAIKNVSERLTPGDFVLFGANADIIHKEEYIRGYYKLNLPKDELDKKVQLAKEGFWLDKNYLIEICKKYGLEAKVSYLPKPVWQSWYMFDLECKKID